MEIEEGSVVIVGTGQSGTVIQSIGSEITVFLTNTCLWYGKRSQAYIPQSLEEILAAPLDVDRFEDRERTGKKTREKRKRDEYSDYDSD